MALFSEYVMVDWSAASRPKRGKDSIWIGCGDGGAAAAENAPTRVAARERVRELLHDALRSGRRALVGFDFPYGYSRGFARALGLDSDPPWVAVWRLLAAEIVDDARNRNNRFDVAARLNRRLSPGAGPFWGCPPKLSSPSLQPLKTPFPHGPLAEFRAVERHLLERRVPVRPLATWQLMYAGCVGSQALVGIPVVHALRFDPALAAASLVWPFETGFVTSPAAAIVHAEIWPGVVDVQPRPGEVKDEAQVKALVREFGRRDRAETLGELFAPHGADEAARREEGWILGA